MGANSVQSKVIPSTTNKGRHSEKQGSKNGMIGALEDEKSKTGQQKAGQASHDLRIKINRNSENCVNQSNNNSSKLEAGEVSNRQHHQDKMKSITIKSMKQGSIAHH